MREKDDDPSYNPLDTGCMFVIYLTVVFWTAVILFSLYDFGILP